MYKLFHQYAGKVSAIIIVLLFSISLWQLAAAGWIQGKAIIAQQLLNSSWNATLLDTVKSAQKNAAHKPWPWADTWPVAKLIVPQQQIEQIILAGDSGSSLAFGPGYSLSGAAPNTPGTTVISGHRDTHFEFLSDVSIDDIIFLQTPGRTVRYQVYGMQVVDSKTYNVSVDIDEHTLVLATCYPFDAITPRGSLRYLIFANKSPV